VKLCYSSRCWLCPAFPPCNSPSPSVSLMIILIHNPGSRISINFVPELFLSGKITRTKPICKSGVLSSDSATSVHAQNHPFSIEVLKKKVLIYFELKHSVISSSLIVKGRKSRAICTVECNIKLTQTMNDWVSTTRLLTISG